MATTKLSPPWVIFYKEINELFKKDPAVRVIYDGEAIKLYVEGDKKAAALTKLLPTVKVWGNTPVEIQVVPANANYDFSKATNKELYEAAFEGNKAVDCIEEVRGLFDLTYVVFKKEIVQYYNDDIGDLNGIRSTLYQDIAEEVFEKKEGIYFCTNKDVFGTYTISTSTLQLS